MFALLIRSAATGYVYVAHVGTFGECFAESRKLPPAWQAFDITPYLANR